ncbi:hypothetical protein [Variovorax sp. OV700]|uniref:hypothetical protein n=1 Tax=Variovorax sp. OV700 TaxID=1882826 RepID=UPI0008845D39|nr:hypothetical protein [Variovorax sp. OV700]SDJ53056.1 hypothetical protein SAMN05444748_11560 [Variovorax sp. OV700]
MMRAPVKPAYVARYSSLFNGGELAFPCDARGRVDLDGLSERARNNYFYARALTGRAFAAPVIMAGGEGSARC